MEFYPQGQDLWEIVGGSEATEPTAEDTKGVLRKWKINIGKSIFPLKITIKEEMLEHIWDARTPKKAYETLVACFSKKSKYKTMTS